jgi:AraC-like DNA-binding protein
MAQIKYLLCTIISLLLLFPDVKAQPENMKIPFTADEIRIDGCLNDWKNYLKKSFADTLSRLQNAPGRPLMAFYDNTYDYDATWHPLSKNCVEVWICWNLEALYFAIQVSDGHLFAEIDTIENIPELHLNDGIEIYLDTKNDSDTMMDINDYQFLIDVSGQNIVFRGDRLLMDRDTTLATPKASGQNIYFEYEEKYNGTLNDSTTDKGYLTEIAIPLAAIGLKPETGLRLKLDIGCNDIDHSLAGTETYEEKALRYWSFNWTGISDFGYPDTWLKAELTGTPGWTDKLSGAKLRQWLTVYFIALGITLLVIGLLLFRMWRIKKLPSRRELSAPKIILIEKTATPSNKQISANEQLLKKAVDVITQNHTETIRSETLAIHLGVTTRKLQRVTQEELQTTPTNFIYLIKLNLAAEYLKSHKSNVSETAYEFGFTDPGYFSKLFKKHFGVSPNEYVSLP